jgi:predicted ArsR family transcriptional regulator
MPSQTRRSPDLCNSELLELRLPHRRVLAAARELEHPVTSSMLAPTLKLTTDMVERRMRDLVVSGHLEALGGRPRLYAPTSLGIQCQLDTTEPTLARDRILNELASTGGPMSAQELADVTQLHAQRVRTILQELRIERLVRVGGTRPTRGNPISLYVLCSPTTETSPLSVLRPIQYRIMEVLQSSSPMPTTVPQISAQFEISTMSARGNLRDLVRQGLVRPLNASTAPIYYGLTDAGETMKIPDPLGPLRRLRQTHRRVLMVLAKRNDPALAREIGASIGVCESTALQALVELMELKFVEQSPKNWRGSLYQLAKQASVWVETSEQEGALLLRGRLVRWLRSPQCSFAFVPNRDSLEIIPLQRGVELRVTSVDGLQVRGMAVRLESDLMTAGYKACLERPKNISEPYETHEVTLEDVIESLSRASRPMSADDIGVTCSTSAHEVYPHLRRLAADGRISKVGRRGLDVLYVHQSSDSDIAS